MASTKSQRVVVVAIVRVRTGIHRDAVVALRPGRWRVGSSIDDDLVLRDPGIRPAHLELVVAPEGIELAASAGGWSIDGAPLDAGEGRTIVAGRRAECFTLAVGDARLEVVWSADGAAASGGWGLSLSPRVAWAAVSFAAVTAIGMTVALLPGGDRPREADHVASSVDPLNGLERRLAETGEWKRVALVHREQAGTERAELRGRVQRRDELERLLRTPEVAAVAPVVRVIVEQELLRQVRDAVADPGLSIVIEEPMELPRSPRGAGDVDGGASAVQRLRVVVSGSTRRTGIPAALKLLNIELGERVEIVDRTLYAPDERDRKTVRVELPIRIASVNASERYIESTEGAKYFEGSVVSGYTVESIEARKVVFNVAGRRIEYPVP